MRHTTDFGFAPTQRLAISALGLTAPILVGGAASAYFLWTLHEPLFCFSLMGSLLLAFSAVQRGSDRQFLLQTALWLPASLVLSKVPLLVVTRLTPQTIDALLDMGVERQIWRWASAHPALNLFCNVAYSALPLALALGIATSPAPRRAAHAMLRAGLIGVALYFFFPAAGPRASALHLVGAAHNCVPSLHATWAAIAAAFGGRSARYYLWPFVGITAAVTITTGEHYFFDLLAAVPLVAFCLWTEQGADRAANSLPRDEYAFGPAYPAS